ncbi:MAG TPA: amidohydrolase family protein [Casimicrobiaceae bacterium]|nr:amidohydrolase family protein [Casimicrobiaceae bacterium]
MERIDSVIRNARIDGRNDLVDVAIGAGRIRAIEPAGSVRNGDDTLDIGGRYVSPGFVETHVHLDKSCIVDRCHAREGTLAEAIREVANAKAAFTTDDVHARAARTLERAILQGTTRMRTHVEVDPGIGLRGFDAVLALVDEYAWAIDLELCVFPQEGLTDNPGTDELIVAALRRGARVVGAAPYVDRDPHGQIDRIFAIARDFDVPVDMHLDFTLDVAKMDIEYVCTKTREHRYEGRVAIGHATTLSALPAARFDAIATMLADAGVAVTVLPSTDLFLMGRGIDRDVPRGVAPVHRLVKAGVNASLATNNVLNPFTPFGDCSLVRMANLYANIAQLGERDELTLCHRMVTQRAAQILGVTDHCIDVGATADLAVLDCENAAQAVAEIAAPLYVFKRGRMTVSRAPASLHRPQAAS